MRPKLLEIEGLQSFTEPQRIDFETLGETGLFGIFGPTGSGKSTILDAITFALYGRVKRADGGTQGIINSGRSTARVSFTFELSRGGSRKTYRVERTYQRKKGSQNACEPKVARLIEVGDDGEVPLCDKAMEVGYFIRELLGLSNEDFTRAVVLPQNSFQEFLLLNNSERRGMLERIFYLEEYGKQLMDKLGRRMAGLKSRIDILSGELKGYADASDEALEAARDAMEAAFAERNRIGKELKQSEKGFQEAKEVWGLVGELEEFARKEKELDSEKDRMAECRLQLEKAVKAGGLAEMILKSRDLREKRADTQKQLEAVLVDLSGASARLEASRTLLDDLVKEAAVEQPRLIGLRAKLSNALEIKKEIEAISRKVRELENGINGLKRAMAEKTGQIDEEAAASDALAKELERLSREAGLLRIDPEYRRQIQDGVRLENEVAVLRTGMKELEGKKQTLAAAAEKLEQRRKETAELVGTVQREAEELSAESLKHDESVPGDRNAALKAIERIRFAQGIYNGLKSMKDELDRIKARLELQRSDLSELIRRRASADTERDKAGEAVERCKSELDGVLREMDKYSAYLLSKKLKEGEPCPVCGSAHHPAPAAHAAETDPSGLEKKVEAARAMLADAEAAFRRADRETVSAVERLKSLTDQKEQLEKEFQTKTAGYDEEKQKLPEKLRALELDQVDQEIGKAAETYSNRLEAIQVWEMKQSEYRERLRQLNEVLADHRMAENTVVTEWKLVRENIGQLEAEADGLQKSFRAVHEEYAAFLQKYGIAGVHEELSRFSENDRKLHLLQMETDQAQKNAETHKALLDKLKEELRGLHTECVRLEADAGGLDGQRREKEAKRKELAGEADIEEEIGRTDAGLEKIEKLEEEYRKALQLAERQYHELLTRKSLLENQESIYADSLKNEEERLQAALAGMGFLNAAEVEASVLPEDRQKELRAEIDEHDRVRLNIRAQKELLQSRLNARTITEEEWNRINSSHTELIAAKEGAVSRSEVTRSSFERIQEKHDKWVGLSRDYAGLNRKQGLFEQIQKILKAEHRKDNSFIDYIAEERLRYVAAKASETIGVMTKYRYALELDVEAGFIVRDNANGGAHRMVTSLSGGETFLTSLSLALALSEQIQLKGQSPLEFFFLDEGFGTLDAELLDTVIDALERLSNRDRVIGLISHVPELKSRIARRLVVEPPSTGSDGSRVKIEKA
jgi:exonuclease SbcC